MSLYTNGKERLKAKFVFFLIKLDVKPTFLLVFINRNYQVQVNIGFSWLCPCKCVLLTYEKVKTMYLKYINIYTYMYLYIYTHTHEKICIYGNYTLGKNKVNSPLV